MKEDGNLRFSREFYRPKDALVEYPVGIPGGEIHRYERGDLLFAAVFGGKRVKPDWEYGFPSVERREKKIAEWMGKWIGRT